MAYSRDPECPDFWRYDGLRIQAERESHVFVVSHAQAHMPLGARVLDLGAGEGALAKQLLDAGFRVSCTSWNAKCRVGAPTFEVNLDRPFSLADVGGTAYPLVCAVEIIEHLENPAGFLRCCHGLLASGGILILSTPNVECVASRMQWLVRGCPRIFDVGEVQNNRHISMMWRQGLDYLVNLAGFRIAERHFLTSVAARNTLWMLAKRMVYQVMEHALSGDTSGTTRLYVLEQSGSTPRSTGPDEVY